MEGMPWYVNWFLLLGGGAVVLGAALKGVPWLADKAGDWLLSKERPAVRKFMIKHWEKIKPILDKCEEEIEKDVQQAREEEAKAQADKDVGANVSGNQ